LLNHEGAADAAICQQLADKFQPSLRVIHEADPRKVKGWIAISKLVVCSRFHGCVSALSSGVPCLGTSWSHKYEALFKEYQQMECLLMPDVDASQLQVLFQKAALMSSSVEAQSAIRHFQQQSQQLWRQVVIAVENGSKASPTKNTKS